MEQGPKDSPPSGLLAGAARTDIAPPSVIGQLTWGSQTHVESAGVDLAGMVATAIVLSDGKQQFGVVDVDCLSTSILEPAIPRAAQKTGIPEQHIWINATTTFGTGSKPQRVPWENILLNLSPGKGGSYLPVEPEYSLGGHEVDMTPYRPAAAAQLIGKLRPC